MNALIIQEPNSNLCYNIVFNYKINFLESIIIQLD